MVVDAIPLAVEETEGTNNTKETQETEQAAYVTYTGTVLEKEEGQDGAWRVTIGNEEGPTLVANLMPGVQVFDAGAPEESKSVEDVEKGMEVTFILPSLSPMTMSLPPQSSSVEAVVLHSADGSFTVGKFDENLVCEEAMLQLNLSEETPISSITGNKKSIQCRRCEKQRSFGILYHYHQKHPSADHTFESGDSGRSRRCCTATGYGRNEKRDRRSSGHLCTNAYDCRRSRIYCGMGIQRCTCDLEQRWFGFGIFAGQQCDSCQRRSHYVGFGYQIGKRYDDGFFRCG